MKKLYEFNVIYLYRVWWSMLDRCSGRRKQDKKNYYDRNIRVCKRLEEFDNFYDDMILTYQRSLQLDRINNNGNYEPSNCRWVTVKENGRNKSNTIFIEYNGQKQPLIKICEDLNLNYQTVYDRYKKGIRDISLLLTTQDLRFVKKPIKPCIICNTIEGYKDSKTNRPYRKKGMCNTCYHRLKNK